MTILLKKPLVLLLSLAVVTTGGVFTYLHLNHSAPAAQVLGEKVTGAGQNGGAATTSNSSNGKGNGNSGSNPAKNFTITGTVEGLAPGVTAKLFLTVTNPNNQDMRVTGLSATFSSVTPAANPPAGTCEVSASNLQIGSWFGQQFTVPKNGSASSLPGYIPVTMPNTVDDACQGATFNLTYSATAVQA